MEREGKSPREVSAETGPARSLKSNDNDLTVIRNISVVIKPMIDKLADRIRWYRSHVDDRCMDRESFDTRKIADRLSSSPPD